MRLTSLQHDALSELMNIAAGRAAAALSGMLNRRVGMRVVAVRLLDSDGVQAFLVEEVGVVGSAVAQDFSGDLDGSAVFMLSHAHAATLVRALLHQERDLARLSAAEQSVLAEVGNVVLNACVAIVADQLRTRLRFQLPRVALNLPGEQLSQSLTSVWQIGHRGLVLASHITVGDIEITAYIIIVMVLDDTSIQRLLNSLLSA